MEVSKEQLDEFVYYLQSLTEAGFVRWRVSKGPLGNEFIAEICAVIKEEPDEDEPVTLTLFNCKLRRHSRCLRRKQNYETDRITTFAVRTLESFLQA